MTGLYDLTWTQWGVLAGGGALVCGVVLWLWLRRETRRWNAMTPGEREEKVFGRRITTRPADESVTHWTDDDAEPDDTETYTEWRLRGQPPGDFPFYDLTFHDPERVASLRTVFERSGERGWTDVTFESRKVTITRTAWKDVIE